MALRCTRIWWVRPVSSWSWSNVWCSKRSSTRKRVPRFTATNDGDGHLLAVAWISPDGGINTSLIQGDHTFYQGQIALDDLPTMHHFGQRGLGACGFRDDQQARSIPIQAVDNAWPLIVL